MTKIEYKDIVIKIPEKWSDIKVSEYEQYFNDPFGSIRERIEVIAKICKIDYETLLKLPYTITEEIIARVLFIFEENKAKPNPKIKIKGINYVVQAEDRLTLGEYVDVAEVQEKGTNVLSNILAIVCRPIGEEYDYNNNEKRAAMFADLTMDKVRGVLAFFLHYNKELQKLTKVYNELLSAVGKLPQSIKIFQSRGGGIKSYRIWRAIKYYFLMKLLKYRLRRFLHSYSLKGIK